MTSTIDLTSQKGATVSSLLRIENLAVDFALHKSTVHAVRDVSLEVNSGEVLAVVGESGSGKSVTAAAVLGLLPDQARVTAGSITFNGTELLGLPETRLNVHRGSGIGMIFQNPVTSLDPSFKIGSQLGETARLHLGLSKSDARTLSLAWLERVGIRDPERVLDAYPHELSGGMRQRVMIALASLSGPDLLIADEPTTALDATVQKQILDLLLTLTRETDTAVLIITHDFGVVAHTSNRVAVMNSGVVVEQGPTEDILSSPQHSYTRALIDSVPEVGQRQADPTRRRLVVGAAEAPASPVVTSARAPEPSDTGPILKLESVSKEFVFGGIGTGTHKKVLTAVDDVSFELHPGEVFGLIGESGSGKSTLARLAGGLLPRTSGVVSFQGDDIATYRKRDEKRFRQQFQYVFQDATTALNPRIPIGTQISRPLLRLGKASTQRQASRIAGDALELVGLSRHHLDRLPREFSGGQRQRVSIARAIALEPTVLILDEPTSALDVTTQANILNLLLDLREELGLTYLFIGHNLAVIEFVCDRIGVMENGKLLETFDAGELLAPDRHASTRALLDSVLPVRRFHASPERIPVGAL